MLLPFSLQVLSDNYPLMPAHPSALDYIRRLWQTATDTITNYQYALSLLMLLAMLRWMLFGVVLTPFLPPLSPPWIIVVALRLLTVTVFPVVNYTTFTKPLQGTWFLLNNTIYCGQMKGLLISCTWS